MSTGYCEELFFRSYLLRRLGQVGLPPKWAAIGLGLIFGLGHGYQGPVGLVSASLLGLFFAWRWLDGEEHSRDRHSAMGCSMPRSSRSLSIPEAGKFGDFGL